MPPHTKSTLPLKTFFIKAGKITHHSYLIYASWMHRRRGVINAMHAFCSKNGECIDLRGFKKGFYFQRVPCRIYPHCCNFMLYQLMETRQI